MLSNESAKNWNLSSLVLIANLFISNAFLCLMLEHLSMIPMVGKGCLYLPLYKEVATLLALEAVVNIQN